MSQTHDLLVLGGGPGGYVAAIRAAQLGQRTALVEREHLGGICLNWGCIPTKALLRTAEILRLAREGEAFGLRIEGVSLDFARVIARSRAVAAQLSDGVKFLLRKNKVTVLEGEGRLLDARRLEVRGPAGTSRHEAGAVILATGARARAAPGLVADGERIWTYREAMVPKALPASVLVIGSGAIGVEFASFYRTLGAEVTLLELLPRILPQEDEEIAGLAAKAFARQGMTILTGAELAGLAATGTGVEAQLRQGGKLRTLKAERAILAIGITGNVEGLGLEALGVRIEKGHVVTDGFGFTGIEGLYAIGDLAGPPWLAHKASHEGVIAAERIAGVAGVHPLVKDRIPACTYSHPQIASVGLTEAAARAAGRSVRVGRFPFRANGKALALGESEGLVKTIFDAASGELLGAHCVGAEVTELVQGFAIARSLETTEAELMATVFPHPTLSEMMHEAVLDAYGRALHL